MQKIYLDSGEFLKDIGERFLDSPCTFETIGNLHMFMCKELQTNLSLDDFLREIKKYMASRGDAMAAPRSGEDTVTASPGRDMDAISDMLKKRQVKRSSYERIMAFGHRGYLDEKYRSDSR